MAINAFLPLLGFVLIFPINCTAVPVKKRRWMKSAMKTRRIRLTGLVSQYIFNMCIFCQIVSGKIPAYKIYEDDELVAFLDIKPISPGHILVIPKKHYPNLEAISEAGLKELIIGVKKMGRLLKDKLGVAGYNVSVNNDPVAGQDIAHLHFHIIPRRPEDKLGSWPQKEYQAGETEEIIKKLTT
jgi:histidine triad (HIT) family protein